MTEDQLDKVFAALADPTRRALLRQLARTGEATVNDLAEPFSISLQAISKHLKVLENAGLISRGRDAQFRPCRLEIAQLNGAAAWLDEYRLMVEQRLDRFAARLREIQGKESS